MVLADLGLIGNCQLSALVRRDGAIVWSCMPRFDSPPVFAALLDEDRGGQFTVGAADERQGVQRYLPNTNVLETRFESPLTTWLFVRTRPSALTMTPEPRLRSTPRRWPKTSPWSP